MRRWRLPLFLLCAALASAAPSLRADPEVKGAKYVPPPPTPAGLETPAYQPPDPGTWGTECAWSYAFSLPLTQDDDEAHAPPPSGGGGPLTGVSVASRRKTGCRLTPVGSAGRQA
ncbi:MAG: hypothetical protein ACE5JG_13670, partial [Planctomycetota bacterium]